MGRSVSIPSLAAQVEYVYFGDFDSDDYQDALDDMCVVAKVKFPSMSACSVWIGREDHAVLENDLAYIGVSEYCGMVAVWVVPKNHDSYGLAVNWAEKVNLAPLARCFGEVVKQVGRFSNGCAVYERC